MCKLKHFKAEFSHYALRERCFKEVNMEKLVEEIYTFKGKVEDCENDYFISVQEKLREYENAEEKGLLLRLKLRPGDKFWELNNNHLQPTVYPRTAHTLQHVLYCMDRLGKTTFLTQEEAEQALKQIGE